MTTIRTKAKKMQPSPDCCALKQYFNALFSKRLQKELNTEDELPPIYAQFEQMLQA